MKQIVSSATACRFTPGVHRTDTPCRRAASRSIMSRPTPYLLTMRSSGTAPNIASSRTSSPVIAFSCPRRNAASASPNSTAVPSSLNRDRGYRASSSSRSVGFRENDRDATATASVSIGMNASYLITNRAKGEPCFGITCQNVGVHR